MVERVGKRGERGNRDTMKGTTMMTVITEEEMNNKMEDIDFYECFSLCICVTLGSHM